jgi:succinate-acetate transporter protein
MNSALSNIHEEDSVYDIHTLTNTNNKNINSSEKKEFRDFANPAPIGLFAFGMTTSMLMFVNTGWSQSSFVNVVICYGFFYGGFVQLLAGIFEFIKGNTFGTSAFISYGAFWMSYSLLKVLVKIHAWESSTDFKTGETLFLCLWGLFTLGFVVPTLRTHKCLIYVFSSLSLTFFTLAGGVWSPACNTAAGYIGLSCGMSAIYTAFAEIYRDVLGFNMIGLKKIKYI